MYRSLIHRLRGGTSGSVKHSWRAAGGLIEALESRLLMASVQVDPGFAMGAMQADPSRARNV